MANAQQQWANALWSRIDGLIDDMASCCVKVRTFRFLLFGTNGLFVVD